MSDERPTALYRHFNASGELLYVGISLSLMNRIAQHKNYSGWQLIEFIENLEEQSQ